MNARISYQLTKFKRLFILLNALLLTFTSQFLQAQEEDYVSNDEGKTWHLDLGVYAEDSSYTEEFSGNISSYIRILDLVDSQYPKYPYPLVFGDADHDGKIEMYRGIYASAQNNFMRVYEFNEDLSYTTTDLQYYGIPWAIGDIDDDGNADLVVQSGSGTGQCDGNGYLRIYESNNANSLPTSLTAELVFPGRKNQYYAKLVDTDQDGKGEVLFSANYALPSCGNSELKIAEWENDTLSVIWTAPDIDYPTFTKAVADFDDDGYIEIAAVTGRADANWIANTYVYENTGDDIYSLIQSWNISIPANNYCWAADAVEETNLYGGDPELVIGLNYSPDSQPTILKWIIYKEANNSFTEWWSTDFSSLPGATFPKHATGDYDNDGLEEIVVADHAYLKIFEFFNSEMQVTWESLQYSPVYLTRCDMRNDGLMNFAVVNFGPNADTVSFYELDPDWITIINDIDDDWQILSVPVLVDDYSADAVFPTHVGNIYGYDSTGYVAVDTLENGPGYWVDFDSEQTIIHSGIIIDSLSIQVPKGWSFLGSISYNVMAGKLCTEPDDIIAYLYRYHPILGYVLLGDDSLIEPGIGYWMKTTQSGTVIMSESCGMQKITASPEIDLATLDRFIITDSNGKQQNLYVANTEIDTTLRNFSFMMPPPLPEILFDARFNYGEFIKGVSADSGVVDLEIVVETYAYPITLTWELNPENGIEYTFISDSGFGKVSKISLKNGQVRFSENSHGRIQLLGKISDSFRINQIPDKFELHPNYPNPFNPGTTIKFSIPEAANVTLNIYNVLGERVAELVNTKLEAGQYNYQWEAGSYASGMYIYELRTDKSVSVKKMLLLK